MAFSSMCRSAPALLAALAFSSGCGDGSGPGPTEEFSLSFTAIPAGTASAAVVTAASITDGTHTLDLTQVEATFSEIGLEAGVDDDDDENEAANTAKGEDDDDGGEGGEFETGPVTVGLPVDGGVVTPFTGPIPVGTYRQMGLEIARVRVRGTYDAGDGSGPQAFDETIAASAEAEKTLDPPFVVSAGAERPNVTIALHPYDWFREANGSLVDPRAINTDTALRSRVRDRIESSLDAFADDDRDGNEDVH
ncbi:MAG: hypothetical protein M3336_04350 [Chloroflexota bacterium]|nr:hypothetical protein [Chloroflexota bacterium]